MPKAVNCCINSNINGFSNIAPWYTFAFFWIFVKVDFAIVFGCSIPNHLKYRKLSNLLHSSYHKTRLAFILYLKVFIGDKTILLEGHYWIVKQFWHEIALWRLASTHRPQIYLYIDSYRSDWLAHFAEMAFTFIILKHHHLPVQTVFNVVPKLKGSYVLVIINPNTMIVTNISAAIRLVFLWNLAPFEVTFVHKCLLLV